MKLLINDAQQNWGKEMELNGANFGFDCEVRYKDGWVETRHNCTEFHHLYTDSAKIRWGSEARSAFESDIHGTGGTVDLDEVELIHVRTATKKNSQY